MRSRGWHRNEFWRHRVPAGGWQATQVCNVTFEHLGHLPGRKNWNQLILRGEPQMLNLAVRICRALLAAGGGPPPGYATFLW
jgi:hypothetical protein